MYCNFYTHFIVGCLERVQSLSADCLDILSAYFLSLWVSVLRLLRSEKDIQSSINVLWNLSLILHDFVISLPRLACTCSLAAHIHCFSTKLSPELHLCYDIQLTAHVFKCRCQFGRHARGLRLLYLWTTAELSSCFTPGTQWEHCENYLL